MSGKLAHRTGPLPEIHPLQGGLILFGMKPPRLPTYADFERTRPRRENFETEEAYAAKLAGWAEQRGRMEALARQMGTTLDGPMPAAPKGGA